MNGISTRESIDCGDISMANGSTNYQEEILFVFKGIGCLQVLHASAALPCHTKLSF